MVYVVVFRLRCCFDVWRNVGLVGVAFVVGFVWFWLLGFLSLLCGWLFNC